MSSTEQYKKIKPNIGNKLENTVSGDLRKKLLARAQLDAKKVADTAYSAYLEHMDHVAEAMLEKVFNDGEALIGRCFETDNELCEIKMAGVGGASFNGVSPFTLVITEVGASTPIYQYDPIGDFIDKLDLEGGVEGWEDVIQTTLDTLQSAMDRMNAYLDARNRS